MKMIKWKVIPIKLHFWPNSWSNRDGLNFPPFLVVNKQEKEKNNKVLVMGWMRVIFRMCNGWK